MIIPRQPVSGPDVARHYDELDELYREIWGDHLHHGLWGSRREQVEQAVVNLIEHLASHLDLQPESSVCDVGCGYGATSALLADRYACDVHGITLSRKQYERACSRGTPLRGRMRFIHGDWLDNSFRDGEFDAVIAVESLAHMRDKPAFFHEAARVLRPGGRLGLCAWLASPAATPMYRRQLLELICAEGRLPSLGTMNEYIHMMRRAGLEPLVMEDLSARVRRTWRIIATRVAIRIGVDRRYQRLLLDRSFESRRFALTILRLLVAYHVGAIRYGIIVARRPASDAAA